MRDGKRLKQLRPTGLAAELGHKELRLPHRPRPLWLVAIGVSFLVAVGFLIHGAFSPSPMSTFAQVPAGKRATIQQEARLMHASRLHVPPLQNGVLTLMGRFHYGWLTATRARIALSHPHQIWMSGRMDGHRFSIWLRNQLGRLVVAPSNFRWNLAGAAVAGQHLWFESPLNSVPILWKLPLSGGVPSGFLVPRFSPHWWAPANVYPLSSSLILYQTLGSLFGGQLRISGDGGQSWRPLHLPQPGLMAQIAGYQAGALYVETISKASTAASKPGSARLWRLTISTTGLVTWKRLPVSAASGSGLVLAVNPVNPQDLAALTLQGMVGNNAVGGSVTPVGLVISHNGGAYWKPGCLPPSATMATGSRSGIVFGNFDRYSLVSWAGVCAGVLSLPSGLTPHTTPDALVGGNGALYLQSGPKLWERIGTGWNLLPAPPHGSSSGLIVGNASDPLVNIGPAGAWALTPAGWSPIRVDVTP